MRVISTKKRIFKLGEKIEPCLCYIIRSILAVVLYILGNILRVLLALGVSLKTVSLLAVFLSMSTMRLRILITATACRSITKIISLTMWFIILAARQKLTEKEAWVSSKSKTREV
nr:MAG TPA: hypothetical protein [Caudoviricetes sp.]